MKFRNFILSTKDKHCTGRTITINNSYCVWYYLIFGKAYKQTQKCNPHKTSKSGRLIPKINAHIKFKHYIFSNNYLFIAIEI